MINKICQYFHLAEAQKLKSLQSHLFWVLTRTHQRKRISIYIYIKMAFHEVIWVVLGSHSADSWRSRPTCCLNDEDPGILVLTRRLHLGSLNSGEIALLLVLGSLHPGSFHFKKRVFGFGKNTNKHQKWIFLGNFFQSYSKFSAESGY